jgi:exopolysaccharide biosynthesis polyprenyl glycosylphosphotransferase
MSDPEAARSRPPGRDRSCSTTPHRSPAIRRVPRRAQLLFILADAGLAEAFFLTALLLAHSLGVRAGLSDRLSGPWPIVLAILFPLIVGSRGLYRLGRFPSWRGQAAAGMRAVAWSIGLSVAALFLFAREISPALRLVLTFYHLMLALWMVVVRPLLAVLLQRRFDAASRLPERALVIGSGAVAMEMARRLRRHPERTEVIALADSERAGPLVDLPFHRAALDEVPELAGELDIDLVVLARPDLPREDVVRLSDQLMARGVHLRVACNILNKLVDNIPLETLAGVPLLPVAETPLTGVRERMKRAFDLLGAAAGGLVILPAILVLALLVRLNSSGPVLYAQTRVGRNGRPFVLYKFRSMRVAKEDVTHRRYVERLLENGGAASTDETGKKIYKLVDEARVTGIGRFLRRTSLDELPQLLNVLRGEMSLVGPRPCVPFEYDLYKDWQKRRLSITPGMTGLWQVTGRSYVDFEDMVLLDLFYIANWSFSMDLKLLARTVPVVVWGKGGL